MLVVFLGAIGGFLSMGFIGLFVGAVILSLGFKLFRVWLEDLSRFNGQEANLNGISSENV
jgi:predicted PurR-regulated permease PerM